MNWYLKVLKNYANFDGRARRSEFWMFVLFNFLFTIAALILDAILGSLIGFGFIYPVYTLAMIIPNIAVTVRRLHDIGKSGGWFFISFIPVIGGIWLIVLLATEGNTGENEYGEDPKAEEDTILYA